MSLQNKFTGAVLTLGLILTLGAPVSAQQPDPMQGGRRQGRQQNEGRGRRPGRGAEGQRSLGLLQQLNLSAAQQQQIRAIEDRFRASTNPQRDEMRKIHQQRQEGTTNADTDARIKALRAQMQQATKSLRQEILGVLTPEQRTQLDQLVKERKARHEERRARRAGQDDDNNR
ncbi:MAG TPA: Spy/CpxP family protein refolding chaperone [Pyrinomonadaceae bacterium]|jgi:Spy/CpxP family protein refolding chaperone